MIRKATAHMGDLIDDLLALFRASSAAAPRLAPVAPGWAVVATVLDEASAELAAGAHRR